MSEHELAAARAEIAGLRELVAAAEDEIKVARGYETCRRREAAFYRKKMSDGGYAALREWRALQEGRCHGGRGASPVCAVVCLHQYGPREDSPAVLHVDGVGPVAVETGGGD